MQIGFREDGMTRGGPTVRDVAAQTGFSVSTVTKVLRGDGERYGIRPQTRRRIQACAKAIGYEASFFARSLRNGHSGLIALVTRTEDFPVRIRAQNLVAQELRKQGAKVLIVDLSWDRGRAITQLLQEITSLHPEAIVAGRMEEPDGERWVQDMLQRGVPVVGMDYVNDLGIDQVYVCRRQVAYLQAMSLLELGHRHIRLTMMKGTDWLLSERLCGFEEAFKAAGRRLTPELFAYLDSDESDLYRRGYEAVRGKGWGASGVTGATAMNDLVALGMLRALGEEGLAVPARISLIGSENLAAAAWYPVPLTTVDWNLEQQAKTAVEWLFERMGGLKSKPRRQAIQPRLVVRQSLAPPAQGQRGFVRSLEAAGVQTQGGAG